MSKNILTAIDIDTNKKTIEKQIEENVIIFNKNRISKKLRELRKEINISNGKSILTKEDIQKVTLEIINDDESLEYREYQKNVLESTKDNYYHLRQTIQSLNELNEFSAEIERHEFQKIDSFLNFNEMIKYSCKKLEIFKKIQQIRKDNISEFFDFYKGKKLSFKEDGLELLLKIREFYSINKSIDDIELFDKFDMLTNIDYSNKLGDYCLNEFVNKNNQNSLINELVSKNNFISKLININIISNKLLGLLLISSTDKRTSFISNNLVTCYDTTYTNNMTNEKVFTLRTLGELLFEITNEDLQYIQKEYRKQIYMTYDGTRPSTEEYYKWNGLQIFDIDLKEWKGDIDFLKKKMFEYLQEFHWFLWICKSASGKGIHIYTKVKPAHHVYINPIENEYICKYWYKLSFETKSAVIQDILFRLHKSQFAIDFTDALIDGFENKFMDMSVSRITSGIRLTSDMNPLVNHNFLDLDIGLNLGQTVDGYYYQETINKLFSRKTKYFEKFLNLFNEEYVIDDISEIKSEKEAEIDLSKFITLGKDVTEIKPLPKSSIKYQLRYNVCNTLAALFGKDGLPLAHKILDSKECGNVGEINSFYSSAINNRKTASKIGLDVLKKIGIIKDVEPELKVTTDNIFKNGIRKEILNSLNNKMNKNIVIELGKKEYLSDYNHILSNPKKGGMTNSKINIIFSPPGSGKTEYIKTLAKEGKRIMIVLPYISVIKNKIENEQEILDMFETYYGSKDIRQIDYGINVVTTFDKFAKSDYEKISKMYDYIFIDESHLLFTSAYRIEATSMVVKKIKDLFFISSNDPFSAKICLLTGTETGESYFFDKVANIIRVSKKSLEKTMEFVIGDDILDCTTRMAFSAYELLDKNYKLLIPTNKGEIYSEKIIGMVEYLLKRKVKYGYYKRSNTEQEICRLINEENSIGDYDVVFCSNYLSVGVDINDKHKFASLYFGNFSGYEIEQFNARIRRTGILSKYFIQTETSFGETNDLLLDEPNLILKITEDDKNNFIDDKSIASAKQEFLAQYDPVLHKITTPGFSYLHGKIQFNLEEYELISFENKYNECMQHPIKVARELDVYGYNIKVSVEYEGLTSTMQQELKDIGMEAAREERIRKHSLLVGTFIDLVTKNTYKSKYGLEYNDVLSWIGKNSDSIIEDRNQEEFVKIDFDVFATPVKVTVKSKEALDSMYKPAKFLLGKYSVTKIIDIINQYIDENGILKQKQFKRAINLLKLIDNSEANEIAEPLTRILEKIYDFVDDFEMTKDFRISYNTYKSTIEEWSNSYIDLLGIRISTQYGFEKIKDGITEILSDIATKSTSKKGIRFSYNKLPEQDSSNVVNRRSVDTMIQTMFRITTDAIENNKKRTVKTKHITLQQQTF